MAGRGGRTAVVEFLGIGVNTIGETLHLARSRPTCAVRSLPLDRFRRQLTVELREVAPLALSQRKALPWLDRGIACDEARIDEPGARVADENEDAHLDARAAPALTAATCRSWSQVQALPVVDFCLRSDLHPLPSPVDISATADSD